VTFKPSSFIGATSPQNATDDQLHHQILLDGPLEQEDSAPDKFYTTVDGKIKQATTNPSTSTT
jgi:hypothetical protein